MNPSLLVDVGDCTESSASIQLLDHCPVAGTVWHGVLRGPFCEYARTLAADFAVSADGSILVTEPCYWTPQMPFLYDLEATCTSDEGETSQLKQVIALRRMELRGQNLYWDGRRTVLRGLRFDPTNDDDVIAAREAGAALLIEGTGEAVIVAASRQGVPIVLDLRNDGAIRPVQMRSTMQQPAVVAAMVDHWQIDADDRSPFNVLLAQVVYANSKCDVAPWANLIVCALDSAERPPGWLADCDHPAFVVRNTDHEPSLTASRRACDRLQAELAPDFDFAGYFVR